MHLYVDINIKWHFLRFSIGSIFNIVTILLFNKMLNTDSIVLEDKLKFRNVYSTFSPISMSGKDNKAD